MGKIAEYRGYIGNNGKENGNYNIMRLNIAPKPCVVSP